MINKSQKKKVKRKKKYNVDDEKRKILIEYFTRYPDEIKSVSFKSFGSPRNYVPALMNIGGTGQIKYL